MVNIILLTALLAAAAPTVQNGEPGYRISGRVYPDEARTVGSPVAGLPAPALPVRGNIVELTGQTQTGSALTVKAVVATNGLFEFERIPSGSYRVTILPKTALDPIDIRIIDRDLEVTFGAPLVRVFGTVSVEDGGPPPPFELRFNDVRTDVLRNHVRVAGGFSAELALSSYRLVAANLPTGFSVKSVTQAGRDITSRDLSLTGSEPVEVHITLKVSTPAPWVRVRGRVVDEPDSTRSPKTTTVTLDGDNAAGTLGAAVQPDGSFEFSKVLPGTYVARMLPVLVDVSRTVTVGLDGVAALDLANPKAKDLAGEFVAIAPGEFLMGCVGDDRRCLPDEKPARRVAITRTFELGKYEVTQQQWELVMGTNPSHRKGHDLPVHSVSWQEAQEFIARLNDLGGEYRYRLPTEAEWEFAAKAGSAETDPYKTESGVFGAFLDSGGQPQPVGGKRPNAWGLYDMRGNVGEWVEDWYDSAYYSIAPALDPAGPLTGSQHVSRGGTATTEPDRARVSTRGGWDNTSAYDYSGFRLARERR